MPGQPVNPLQLPGYSDCLLGSFRTLLRQSALVLKPFLLMKKHMPLSAGTTEWGAAGCHWHQGIPPGNEGNKEKAELRGGRKIDW